MCYSSVCYESLKYISASPGRDVPPREVTAAQLREAVGLVQAMGRISPSAHRVPGDMLRASCPTPGPLLCILTFPSG